MRSKVRRTSGLALLAGALLAASPAQAQELRGSLMAGVGASYDLIGLRGELAVGPLAFTLASSPFAFKSNTQDHFDLAAGLRLYSKPGGDSFFVSAQSIVSLRGDRPQFDSGSRGDPQVLKALTLVLGGRILAGEHLAIELGLGVGLLRMAGCYEAGCDSFFAVPDVSVGFGWAF